MRKDINEKLEEISKMFMAKPEEALELLLPLEEEALSKNYDKILIEVRFRKAQIENLLGRYASARSKLERIYEKIKDSDDDKAKIKVVNEMGNTYFALGLLDDALRAYMKSLEFLEKYDNKEQKAIPINNIGQIYWQLGDLDKAREYYQRSYGLVKDTSPSVRADALINLGILEAQQAKLDEAEKYFLEAEKHYMESNESSRHPLICSNLALLYQDKQEKELAEKYYKLAWEEYKRSGNEFGEMHTGSNYAGFLIDNSKLDNVLQILDRCLDLAERFELDDYKLQLYDYYRFYYQKKRKYKSAYTYLERLHNTEVELLKSEQKQKIAESLSKFEDEQKEKEAKLLRDKNQKIEKQKEELDHAYSRLQKANLELENRFEELLSKWHSREIITRDKEKLDGFQSIISGIAHQWKQPLNYIGICVQNLLDSYEFDEFSTTTLEDFSRQIHDQLKYMADIVDDFAYGFRKMRESEDFKLSHTFEIIMKLMKKSLQLENIELQINFKSDPPVKGRESEILQVFVVLISNAIEIFQMYLPEYRNIIIDVNELADKVVIDVFNNGPHIPHSVMPHIFEAFYSTKNAQSNTGLGLALARKILKEHFDADIICNNVENGVKFTISIQKQG